MKKKFIQKLILRYLLSRINPYELLAEKLGMRLIKGSGTRFSIYLTPSGERYVQEIYGFLEVEQYNTKLELRKTKVDFEMFQSEYKELSAKNDNLRSCNFQISEIYERLQTELNQTIKEMEDLESKYQREIQLLKCALQEQVAIERGKYAKLLAEKKDQETTSYMKLNQLYKKALQDLTAERIKNTNLAEALNGTLGNKKKSAIIKVLNSGASQENQLAEIRAIIYKRN